MCINDPSGNLTLFSVMAQTDGSTAHADILVGGMTNIGQVPDSSKEGSE